MNKYKKKVFALKVIVSSHPLVTPSMFSLCKSLIEFQRKCMQHTHTHSRQCWHSTLSAIFSDRSARTSSTHTHTQSWSCRCRRCFRRWQNKKNDESLEDRTGIDWYMFGSHNGTWVWCEPISCYFETSLRWNFRIFLSTMKRIRLFFFFSYPLYSE